MRTLIKLSVVPMLFWTTSAFAETPIETPGYGWLLFKTIFVLIGICLLAFIGLRYLSKVNIGRPGPMKILGRLPIEGRRSIVVVDVAGKTLIIGSSEAGMQTLGDLNTEERQRFEEITENKENISFKERLRISKKNDVLVEDNI